MLIIFNYCTRRNKNSAKQYACILLLERKLFYLDPHRVQPYVDFNNIVDSADDSFHCACPSYMDICHLDPSIAIVCFFLPYYAHTNVLEFGILSVHLSVKCMHCNKMKEGTHCQHSNTTLCLKKTCIPKAGRHKFCYFPNTKKSEIYVCREFHSE